jgi:hypothetical protein
MTHLIIDTPIILMPHSQQKKGLLLNFTPAPHIFVAQERYLIVVVLGHGVTDLPRELEIWDVNIGWHFKPGEEWSEEHHTPYVLPQNKGKSHTKITFRKKVASIPNFNVRVINDALEQYKAMLLSRVAEASPRSDRPGGNRGSQAEGLRRYHQDREKMVEMQGGPIYLTPGQRDKLLNHARRAGVSWREYLRVVIDDLD